MEERGKEGRLVVTSYTAVQCNSKKMAARPTGSLEPKSVTPRSGSPLVFLMDSVTGWAESVEKLVSCKCSGEFRAQ